MDYAVRQAPLFMGFPKQEYWSGLPCPPPSDLPNPGIKPKSPASLALAGGFFTTESPGKALRYYIIRFFKNATVKGIWNLKHTH